MTITDKKVSSRVRGLYKTAEMEEALHIDQTDNKASKGVLVDHFLSRHLNANVFYLAFGKKHYLFRLIYKYYEEELKKNNGKRFYLPSHTKLNVNGDTYIIGEYHSPFKKNLIQQCEFTQSDYYSTMQIALYGDSLKNHILDYDKDVVSFVIKEIYKNAPIYG